RRHLRVAGGGGSRADIAIHAFNLDGLAGRQLAPPLKVALRGGPRSTCHQRHAGGGEHRHERTHDPSVLDLDEEGAESVDALDDDPEPIVALGEYFGGSLDRFCRIHSAEWRSLVVPPLP